VVTGKVVTEGVKYGGGRLYRCIVDEVFKYKKFIKMKRSRNEVVKATVGSYLKRRHYTVSGMNMSYLFPQN
jgi:hypothetical protein